MRKLLVTLGVAAIVAYSVLGALLMTWWELEVASGVSFDETLTKMEAAGQPHSYLAGIIFAVLGIGLAIAWAIVSVMRLRKFPGWFSPAIWGAIVAFGAAAYFFASFGNMNSVGDTFYEWNADAAFALVSPLYIFSGIGAVIAIAALIIGLMRSGSSAIGRSSSASVPAEIPEST